MAPSILHKVSVSPGGEKSAYSAGWCPRQGLNSPCSHGLLSAGTTALQPSPVTHCSLGGARAGLPPHRPSQTLILGWACPLHKGGAWPLAHPAVSTDAPRGLAEAPCLPCPVLLTSCLLGPPGKHPAPHSDGPLSAPGACCQGPGTHSLPGVGAPQGLTLGWGPRGSAGGGRGGEHMGWRLPWWLDGAPSVRGRPPSSGLDGGGGPRTTQLSQAWVRVPQGGERQQIPVDNTRDLEAQNPGWEKFLASTRTQHVPPWGQRAPSDGPSPCPKPFLLG